VTRRPISILMARTLLRDIYFPKQNKPWQVTAIETSVNEILIYYTGVLDRIPRLEFRGYALKWIKTNNAGTPESNPTKKLYQ
jgi:hypothetical protein